jgi:peptide/nickel transport system ATP-binding protein
LRIGDIELTIGHNASISRKYAGDLALTPVAPNHEVRCLRPNDREDARPRAPIPVPKAGADRPAVLGAKGLRAFYGRFQVLHDVTFDIDAGQCVGLVGESGSGKTTLARCLAGLHGDVDGLMAYQGEALPPDTRHRSAAMRQRIQYVFQNPYGSFNPRRSIGASLAMALSQFVRLSSIDRRRKILSALDQVSLPASVIDRYPCDLSGGQRQRAAIARALISDPDLLICDEITSALDVSVQAVITELLSELQREQGLTLLFVTHNLAFVRGIAQQVLVMQDGRLVEAGRTDDVMRRPQAEETKRLLRDAPRFSAVKPEASLIE